MADTDLQTLLDPSATGNGIRILRRTDASTTASYFCQGNVTGVGKAMWVNTLAADSDATKNTAIRTAFGVS